MPYLHRLPTLAFGVVLGLFLGAGPASAGAAAPSDPIPGVPAQAPNGAAGSDQIIGLTVNGMAREYRLFVPNKLPATGAKLVIGMHPLNGTAAGFESSSNLDIGAGQLGTLVAYPAGFENSWNAGTCCGYAQKADVDDVAFIDAVIDDVESRYSVDTSAIAMGGFSNGSFMTYRYICERSDRVHLAFIGSGALVAPTCTFTRSVRVLHMHGMKDGIVPWAGTTNSTYTSDGVMPPVATTINAIARQDGCAPQWPITVVNSFVNKYVPASCPDGASITVFQSKTLMHGWVSGSDAMSKYGINETNATWNWLWSNWSST